MSERRRRALRLALGWLLLEAVAAAQVARDDGTSLLVIWMVRAVEPVHAVSAAVATALTDLSVGFAGLRQMMVEHRDMREEIDRLTAENILLQGDVAALVAGSSALSSLVLLSEDCRLARCTYHNVIQGRMLLHAADRLPLAVDSAVMAGAGLVGRVVSTVAGAGWVQLISHPASAVAVESDDGSVHGLVVGVGAGRLAVEFVPRGATLLRGELLVSSGADGVVTPGIPVARVAAVRETGAAFLEVVAVPCVNLSEVRAALVLPPWSNGQLEEQ